MTWRSILYFHLHLAGGSSPPTPTYTPAKPQAASTRSASTSSDAALAPASSSHGGSSNKLRAPNSLGSQSPGAAKGGFNRSFSSTSGHSSWKVEHGRLVEVMANWMLPPVLVFLRVECRTYASTSEVALVR